MLAGLVPPEGYCLRIRLRNRAIYLALDMPRADDQQFSHQGELVLVADPDTLEACAAYVLDFDVGDFCVRQAAEFN